jgi:hypothetical protein
LKEFRAPVFSVKFHLLTRSVQTFPQPGKAHYVAYPAKPSVLGINLHLFIARTLGRFPKVREYEQRLLFFIVKNLNRCWL